MAKIRENSEMEFFKQTTEYTCAASSLLIILHHLKGIPLTKEEEFNIWLRSANLPVRASSIYALAIIAHEHGLKPRIVLEEKEYDYPDYRFKGYTKVDIDEAKFSSKLYAKKARKLGIIIEEKEVTLELVKKELSNNKILMLRINTGSLWGTKSTSRYVVVHNSKEEIRIMDPERGTIIVNNEDLKEAMITLQTKKKRDVRMIVFE